MENNGKERGRYYPASITFMQYISSWEAEGEGKPWAFPVLCFRLTFKTYCFKMLIVMSDISCVTKWIVTAEGETFFLTISLPAKEGWLKMEQRWGGGSDRRAIRANGRWWGPAAKHACLVANEDPLLDHSVQPVQWHLSASHPSRLQHTGALRKTVQPIRNQKHSCTQLRTARLFLQSHPEYATGKWTCIWRCNRPIQAISGELKHCSWNVIRVHQL